MLQHFLNGSKRKWLEKRLKTKYGYLPRITEFKGKIYISDPTQPSEPWEVYENEYDMWKQLNN